MMDLIQIFKERELLAQCTNLEAVEELLKNKKITFYIGFDPTADSLHIGHFMQMKTMKYFQEAGHKPIALFGGGTTMVGDPTGKTDLRKMLTREEIEKNIENFKKQADKYIPGALYVNNADWLCELNYVEFLREVGVHYPINRMLAAECVKSRLEKGGLTFLEFNYMLMQGYDFYRLYNDHDCILQLGGDDQWSNIISGVELIRRKDAKEAYGMTFALLPDGSGKKMGKTEKNAVWIDPDKTSPYDFYQFWRNTDDSLVIKYMKMLTRMPMEEIKEFESYTDSKINIAKEKLAFEVTKMIHDEDEAKKAQEAAKALFSSGSASANENMPTTTLTEDNFIDGKISILDLLTVSKLALSKGEAKRLIDQGGVCVGEEKITQYSFAAEKSQIEEEGLIIKKGKKIFHRFICE